ncbi:MAG: hypothetical protein QM770_11915 [Tepidisphaeraceae bacterium]
MSLSNASSSVSGSGSAQSPSLVELVERVRAGQSVDEGAFDAFADSTNQAERFLANYARATLSLRQGRELLFESLRTVDFADPTVLKQFLDVSNYVGQRDLNAWAIYRYGKAVTNRDWPAALGAIQDAIRLDQLAGGGIISQRENWTDVAGEYERAARMIGKRAGNRRRTAANANETINVGYLTSSVVDETPTAALLTSLARYMDTQRFSLRVYVTDAPSREPATSFASFAPAGPSSERGDQTLSALKGRRVESWMLPGGLDVVRAARMLVERVQCDSIDVLLVDASLADSAAWIAIANRAATAQIALVRKRPVGATGVDQVVWLDDARREADSSYWQQQNVPTTSIRQGIDTDLRAAPADRAGSGVPADATVLMTYTHRPEQTLSRTFVDAVVQLLQVNPQTVFLAGGEGDFGAAKKLFEAAGMSKRVGFAARDAISSRSCGWRTCTWPSSRPAIDQV